MILFHKVIVDLVAFGPAQFGVFNESEKPVLTSLWSNHCDSSSTKFLAALSPDQKARVAKWACERSSFSLKELIEGLTKFLDFLRSAVTTASVYPMMSSVASEPIAKGKSKRLRFGRKKDATIREIE